MWAGAQIIACCRSRRLTTTSRPLPSLTTQATTEHSRTSPAQVHDLLNATHAVRFKGGVRANLIRTVYARLRTTRPGQLKPLGEYATDAVGGCDVLRNHGRDISSSALLAEPLVAGTTPVRNLGQRFAPMADQCAAARLADPVVCCGEPRHCGEQACDPTWHEVTRAFAYSRPSRSEQRPANSAALQRRAQALLARPAARRGTVAAAP